jgi:Cu/Ag efflux protein CusF
MTTTHKLLIAATLLAGAFSAYAASHAGAPIGSTAAAQKASVMVAAADMADGEIRKVDIENKKLTIKHGEIKNLDMPGMTMVFQVKDPAMLTKVKAGDKVKFSVEKSGSAIVVTDIQLAK